MSHLDNVMIDEKLFMCVRFFFHFGAALFAAPGSLVDVWSACVKNYLYLM